MNFRLGLVYFLDRKFLEVNKINNYLDFFNLYIDLFYR